MIFSKPSVTKKFIFFKKCLININLNCCMPFEYAVPIERQESEDTKFKSPINYPKYGTFRQNCKFMILYYKQYYQK